jgi:hypothetical protein
MSQISNKEARMLVENWKGVLRGQSFGKLSEYKERCMAILFENQLKEFATNVYYQDMNKGFIALEESERMLSEAAPANNQGGFPDNNANLKGFTVPLMTVLRRALPYMMAFDVAGVSPMSAPQHYVFALKARYTSQDSGLEALFNEADTDFTGTGTHSAGLDPFATGPSAMSFGSGLSTASGEALGTGGASPDMPEMALSIDRIAVEAKTRALRAAYTHELMQDLMAVHGMDAQKELAEIVATELLSEINREVIRTIYYIAKVGCQDPGLANAGKFDLNEDADGRYHAEKYIGLIIQFAREANQIARETRRGIGNIIITDPNTAAALSMAKLLDCTDALKVDIGVEESGRTYVGSLMGRWKLYADPYIPITKNFAVVGLKGASQMEAGFWYCPYVPLQMFQATDPKSYQPSLAVKTRYGICESPFGNATGTSTGAFTAGTNVWYRKFEIENIL